MIEMCMQRQPYQDSKIYIYYNREKTSNFNSQETRRDAELRASENDRIRNIATFLSITIRSKARGVGLGAVAIQGRPYIRRDLKRRVFTDAKLRRPVSLPVPPCPYPLSRRGSNDPREAVSHPPKWPATRYTVVLSRLRAPLISVGATGATEIP